MGSESRHLVRRLLPGLLGMVLVAWGGGNTFVSTMESAYGVIAATQATAQKERVWRAARNTSLIDSIDIRNAGGAPSITCPSCGIANSSGKFCSSCGTALAAKNNCSACGAKLAPGAKFCAGRGRKS